MRLADRSLNQDTCRGRSFCESRQPAPPCRAACLEVSQSFFSLLQKNALNRKAWATREQLRIAIVTWIERTYHRRRRHARLGRLTPVEFEAIMTTRADQAA